MECIGPGSRTGGAQACKWQCQRAIGGIDGGSGSGLSATASAGYLIQLADGPVEQAGPASADAKRPLSANLTCSGI